MKPHEFDDGDPEEMANQYAMLLRERSHLRVVGGCCGTDIRHNEAIAHACIASS